MNLSLTPELEQFIQHKINSGMYTNASEVVRDALRRMDERSKWQELQDFLSLRVNAAKAGKIIAQDFDSILSDIKKS